MVSSLQIIKNLYWGIGEHPKHCHVPLPIDGRGKVTNTDNGAPLSTLAKRKYISLYYLLKIKRRNYFMSRRTRPLEKKIRFTKKELDYVQKKITYSRLDSFQSYAHTMLIQGEVIQVDYSGLLSLVSEVKRIGININQVTKLANQFSDISDKDIKDLNHQLENLTLMVNKTLKAEIKKHSKQREVDYLGLHQTFSNKNI